MVPLDKNPIEYEMFLDHDFNPDSKVDLFDKVQFKEEKAGTSPDHF